jgi:8-oxo-dGTP diphosphatase
MAKKTGAASGKRAGGGSGRGASASAEERAFLEEYRRERYPQPSVTVDIVILTIVDADLKVLLVRRKDHPFKGCWALPGGFVRVGDGYEDQGEDLDEAAERELAEETGLARGMAYLDQLRTFGKPYRDPRMRIISVAFFALVRPDLVPFVHAGTDAAEADWFSVSELERLELAFDHRAMIQTAIERIRSQIETSNIAFELVPKTFTISELRAVYEVIHGTAYDPGNFRRRFNRLLEDGVIEQAPGKRITTSRPAKVYRFKRS